VDFTEKNGPKRLAEIRDAIKAGAFTHWLELVFIPLYGKERGETRSRFVEEVLRFESDLFHAQKISARLLAATLILSNKLIDKQVLYQIWEEVKMLDILEVAREKGIEEGKLQGLQEGKLQGLQEGKLQGLQEGMVEMVIEVIVERFGIIPIRLSEQIRSIHNHDALKGLFHQSLQCQSLQDFEKSLQQVL
jgi:predicted transposase YdaD